MWQDLRLVHREASDNPQAPLRGKGLLWKTCLREILFLDPSFHSSFYSREELPQGGLLGLDAHRFLVEVCSGLHSPLFGETEVFGQFRAFRASQRWDYAWCELLDAVEEDVRKLRRTHLVDIGSQSYGSLARRHLPTGEPVVVVGGGHLAQELLPWLGDRPVQVAVRDPRKVDFASAISLGELASRQSPSHWLIAAPVSNEQLATWWKATPPLTVLDFRGESSFEDAPVARYFALQALFAELETVRSRHAKKRAEALEFAAKLASRRADVVVHRPYGWEDAFA